MSTPRCLRPDYRALLLAVGGLVPGPSDPASDALLQAAEAAAREALRGRPTEELPHVATKPAPTAAAVPPWGLAVAAMMSVQLGSAMWCT